MNTYTIFGSTGRRFSFNAKNDQEADDKLWNWLRYHDYHDSVTSKNFSVVRDDTATDIHNEWVR